MVQKRMNAEPNAKLFAGDGEDRNVNPGKMKNAGGIQIESCRGLSDKPNVEFTSDTRCCADADVKKLASRVM